MRSTGREGTRRRRNSRALGLDGRRRVPRRGLAPVEVTLASDAEHLPCAACGAAAPLIDGACSDCGLQLE
jgi:hypothetical protein